MQILLFSSNANANTFLSISNTFSNTLKYFDRYAISRKKNEKIEIIKNNKFYEL